MGVSAVRRYGLSTSFSVLAAVALITVAGCAKEAQSQLLPANAPLALVRGHNTSAVESVIYSFAGGSGSTADGVNPRAGLLSVDGTLYGTTFVGGDYRGEHPHGFGTVFSVTPYGTETVLYRFVRPGRYPYAGLIGVDGTLYGTTEEGEKGNEGTLFKIATSGAETVLHRFGRGADGAGPRAAMIDVKGTLYGTTEAGGGIGCNGYGCGTVFSITPSGEETVLHSFGSGEGAVPFGGLVNVKGTLYGTTYYGNASGVYGTVFAIAPSGKQTVLHGFKGSPSDGAEPWAGLVNVNGTLYGTTSVGGANSCRSSNQGCGTVFSITPSGMETVLYSFKGGMSDGGVPEAGLLNVNGTMYGTTYNGGLYGGGTVFSITPAGSETVIHSFNRPGSGDGAAPQADLIDVNGTLYGTTVGGGEYGDGTVFSLSP
jgi:uncharacterized repeat protein (TIGR03803 family)